MFLVAQRQELSNPAGKLLLQQKEVAAYSKGIQFQVSSKPKIRYRSLLVKDMSTASNAIDGEICAKD